MRLDRYALSYAGKVKGCVCLCKQKTAYELRISDWSSDVCSSGRLSRTSMIDVLHADYIRTARAKGLGEFIVVFKHALRNAMIPVVTMVGLQFGNLLAGAVLVEKVFGWPGLGRLEIGRAHV